MAKHEFGIMQVAPQPKKRYEQYEPEKYHCISVDDKYIKPLLPQFAEFDFYWHTIDVSRKGLAYSGISLISPEMFDTLIDMIKNKEGLQELEQLLTKAKVENKYVIIKTDNPSELERFDYIVANPPFSLKNWSDGLKEFGRFSGYGDRPPEKNGDYAWLMHILKTLKSTGKAAVILPHGVLFRGNAEATIRQTIVDKGWIKGIISLPPNLFYGTGIPACILVIDKEGAENRAGIFMIDAGKGYVKDGSKNRLREQDIYRIVTTFNEQITTDPKYARFVPNKEIKEKNGYNLNISRYIDSSDPEDIQSIYAHIHGGIPAADIDALEHFWTAFPTLKNELFGVFSEGYYKLNVKEDVIRQTTYSNAEFAAYGEMIDEAFSHWKSYADSKLRDLMTGVSAKELIVELAQAILKEFEDLSLINKYDVYQVLLAYWNEVLSDDVSMIISDEAGYGVARETENIMKETKKKDEDGNPELKVAGWEGKLIPKELIVSELFPEEKKAMDDLVEFVAETDSRLMSLIEESAEDSILSDVAEGGKVKSKTPFCLS